MAPSVPTSEFPGASLETLFDVEERFSRSRHAILKLTDFIVTLKVQTRKNRFPWLTRWVKHEIIRLISCGKSFWHLEVIITKKPYWTKKQNKLRAHTSRKQYEGKFVRVAKQQPKWLTHVHRNKHLLSGIILLRDEKGLQTFDFIEQSNILKAFYKTVFRPEHVIECPALKHPYTYISRLVAIYSKKCLQKADFSWCKQTYGPRPNPFKSTENARWLICFPCASSSVSLDTSERYDSFWLAHRNYLPNFQESDRDDTTTLPAYHLLFAKSYKYTKRKNNPSSPFYLRQS